MSTSARHSDKNTIIDQFNNLAPVYESNRLSPWYKAHAQAILKSTSLDGAGDLLDIGCGTGYFLRHYLQDNTENRAVGIDIAPDMISVARNKAKLTHTENLSLIKHDWDTIDISDIDLPNLRTIICANTLHYFTDAQVALNKMSGMLKSGNMIYLLERDKSKSLLTMFWDVLHRTIIKDHVQFYDQQTLFKLLEQAGFENIKIDQHIKRYCWKGKLFTNVILISAQKA